MADESGALEPETTRNAQIHFLAGVSSILVSLALLLAAGTLISGIRFPVPRQVYKEFVFASSNFFNPEPAERLVYLTALILLPLSIFCCHLVVFRALARRGARLDTESLERFVQWVVVATLVLVAGMIRVQTQMDLGRRYPLDRILDSQLLYHQPIASIAAAGLVLLLISAASSARGGDRRPAHRLPQALCSAAGVALPALILLMVPFDAQDLTYGTSKAHHFNVVFHSVVQVQLGRCLLVDFVHQYGLYPQLIAPLFDLIELNVRSFTLLMATLLAGSFFLEARVLKGLIRNPAISLAALVTLIYQSYLAVPFSHALPPDVFFQYHPLRSVFPALSIYLTWKWLSTQRPVYYRVSFPVSAVACLWNADTGVVVFLAWLALICFQELGQPLGRAAIRIALHLLKGVAVLALTIGLYALWVRAHCGAYPDFGRLFAYQKLFYVTGHSATPMPLIGVWNLVVLTYLAGLSYSSQALIRRQIDARHGMVFFLTLLGAGLFAYFQNRSLSACLIPVSGPAILIFAVLVDELDQQITSRRRVAAKIVLLGLLCWPLASSLVSFAARLDDHAETMASAWRPADDPHRVLDHLEFVRRELAGQDKALCLSDQSGLYHLASGTICPLAVASHPEMATWKEWQKVIDALNRHEPDLPIVLDLTFYAKMQRDVPDRRNPGEASLHPDGIEFLRLLHQNYRLKAVSSEPRVEVWVSRPEVTGSGP